MKYWEKFLQEKTEKLRREIEFLTETGHCGLLLCDNCPFLENGNCKKLTMSEMEAILNEEVDDDEL